MKLQIFLLLLIVPFIAASEQTNRPPTEWQPIVGYNDNDSKAYVDKNSIERVQKEKVEYASGDALIELNELTPVMFEDKEIPVRSIVRSLIIDCTHGLSLTIMEYYFDVAQPLRSSEPVMAYQYEPDSNRAKEISKSSLIYKTFCPVYL